MIILKWVPFLFFNLEKKLRQLHPHTLEFDHLIQFTLTKKIWILFQHPLLFNKCLHSLYVVLVYFH